MKKAFAFLVLFLLLVSSADAQIIHTDIGKGTAVGSLEIDGTPQTGITLVGASTSVTLSTTKTNDIIYVFSKAAYTSGALSVSGVSDTSGLTWVYRTNSRCTAGGGVGAATMEAWYAVAPSALSSDVITVTWANTPASARISVFGVSGADTTTPFDSNASIPTCFGSTSQSSPKALTISTTSVDTMIVAQIGGAASFGTITRPSGFAQMFSTGSFTDISDSIVSSAQSSISEQWGWTGGSQATFGAVIDAIRARNSP